MWKRRIKSLHMAVTSLCCLSIFPKDWNVRVIVTNKSETNCKSLACSLYCKSACTSARNVDINHSKYNFIFLTLTVKYAFQRMTQITTHWCNSMKRTKALWHIMDSALKQLLSYTHYLCNDEFIQPPVCCCLLMKNIKWHHIDEHHTVFTASLC